jgi:hypothetical protein
MKNVKDFDTWVNEDFAQLDTTPGMGDAVAPTSTTMGSGDQWPSLGIPYSHPSLKPKRKRRKKRVQKAK